MALKKIKRHCYKPSTGNYEFEAKIVHRDNKDYYNLSGGGGSGSGYKIRIPSLKRNEKVWKNFWKLFPYLQERIMWELDHELWGSNKTTLIGNVIIRKEVRTHGGITRTITTKYLKTW